MRTDDSEPDGLAEAIERATASGQASISPVVAATRYAIRLVKRLEPLGIAHRRLLLANVPEGMLRAVSERLREEARDRRHTQPHETLQLADLAVATAERMGEAGVVTLAEALTERGNARRLVADVMSCERDLEQAGHLLEEQGCDPLAEAELFSLRASLARDKREFPRAVALAERAHEIYTFSGQASGALGTLIQVGTLHGYAGSYEAAIELLRRALESAQETGGGESILHVANNLVFVFTEAGLGSDAVSLIERTRDLCHEVGSWADHLRLDWLEARSEARWGDDAAAARILEGVLEGYRDAAVLWDMELVSLELASVYARMGRLAAARRLAGEAVAFFRGLGMERERRVADELLRCV